jgi:hypothetical protein
MRPSAIFLKAEKDTLHIIFSASLPKGRAFAPYGKRGNYELQDSAGKKEPWPRGTKFDPDPNNAAAVVIHVGKPELDPNEVYTLVLTYTGDTFSSVKVGEQDYPNPKLAADPAVIAQVKAATDGLSAIKDAIGTAADTLGGGVSTAAKQVTTKLGDVNTAVGNVSSKIDDVKDTVSQAATSLGGGKSNALLGFPFLTEQVTPRTTSPELVPGPSGGSSLQRTVDAALRTVLGRSLRADDAKGFQAALTASFALSDFEGHRVWTYTPRSFAGAAEFGESLTGIQASLVAFGKNALDQTLPLIDSVTTLDPAVDLEEVEAARAILRTEWSNFVQELANEGGPRAPRADLILNKILAPGTGYLDNFGILLGMLDRLPNGQFAISRKFVIKLEDEDDLTQYISIRNYINSVGNSWTDYRNNFFRSDLGTSLVFLSRALSMVADQIIDVTDALDSVYLGQPERLSIYLDLSQVPAAALGLGAGTVPVPADQTVLLDDVFTWISVFVNQEAGELIEKSGRRGAPVISDTATLLFDIITAILGDIAAGGGTVFTQIPPGLQHPRVIIPLQDLAVGLSEVMLAAGFVASNTVSAFNPQARRGLAAARRGTP